MRIKRRFHFTFHRSTMWGKRVVISVMGEWCIRTDILDLGHVSLYFTR